MVTTRIDDQRALEYLLCFLAVEGISGQEKAIGLKIMTALRELGLPADAMRFDAAHEQIPEPTEAGNLIVDVEGDPALPRRLFMAHRDTVPLCAGVRPARHGDRIVSTTPTALGGDNRASVACLVNMIAELRRHRVRHPPLTLLFTVREESGLQGARHVDLDMLGQPSIAFNLDGPSATKLVLGAVGAAQWQAEIEGRAAHAGLHPEQGISAALVAAHALTTVQRRGWWGRIRRPSGEGTSNVGSLAGKGGGAVGNATNVVTDYVRIEGEVRSHDTAFMHEILAAHRRACDVAAKAVCNDQGDMATVAFDAQVMFEPFRLEEDSDRVRFFIERSRSIGLEPSFKIADGGLDANWMTRHGIPTLTFGIGQRNIHTVEEYVDIPDFLDGCRLALALAHP